MSRRRTRPAAPRGFALVVVVVLLAVLGIAVAVQLDAAKGHVSEAARHRQEAQARGVAETCLDFALAQARGYMLSSTPPPADFDPILDPDLDPLSNDNFIPPASSVAGVDSAVVFLPSTSTSELRRYRYFAFPDTETGCLVRFDDNSDDASPDMPLAATSNSAGVGEGPDAGVRREVIHRDRDRAIIATAIGLFPVRALTPPDDAYNRARARVALRRYLETSGGPGVWATDEIVTASDDAICALGGLTAEEVVPTSSTVCACGLQQLNGATTITNACDYLSGPGDACDDNLRACEPRAVDVVEPQEDPTATIDQNIAQLKPTVSPAIAASDPRYWFSSTVIGDPSASGSAQRGELFVRDRDALDPITTASTTDTYGSNYDSFVANSALEAEIFVWSHLPQSVYEDVVSVAGLTCMARFDELNASGATISTATCMDYDTCLSPAAGPARFPPGSATPLPCELVPESSSDTLSAWRYRCTTPQQSPCWRIAAQLDGNANQSMLQPIVAGALTIEFNGGVGFMEPTQMAGTPSVERFAPPAVVTGVARVAGVPVPLPPPVTDLLGPVGWRTYFNPPATTPDWPTTHILRVPPATSRITVDAAWQKDDDFAPNPILLFENPLDDPVRFEAGGAFGQTTNFIRTTIAASGGIDFERSMEVLCSACGTLAAPATRLPHRSGGGGANPKCVQDLVTTGLNPFSSQLPLIHAGGDCVFDQPVNLVGDIQCGTIHLNDGGCVVGDLTAMSTSAVACAGVSDGEGCGNAGVCVGQTLPAPLVSTTIVGIVLSKGDSCLLERTTVYGQVIADDDVGLRKDVTINHDGSGAVGAIVSTAAWMEASR